MIYYIFFLFFWYNDVRTNYCIYYKCIKINSFIYFKKVFECTETFKVDAIVRVNVLGSSTFFVILTIIDQYSAIKKIWTITINQLKSD